MSEDTHTLSETVLARWSAAVAPCFDPDTVDAIPRQLGVALKALVPHDFTTLVILNRNAAPLVVHDEFTEDVEPVAFEQSPYVFDPPYQHLLAGTLPVTCRLRDLMPEGFEESDFFRYYYDHAEAFDDYLFNIPVGESSIFQVAMTRVGADCDFVDDECARFDAVEPIVTQAVRRFANLRRPELESAHRDANQFHRHLHYVIENFGSSLLTARERQVVAMSLKGYSDALTADRLSISTSTLRNHKKSIYRKLGVTSQGQVFGLLLEALALGPSGTGGMDPVATLLAARPGKMVPTG